VKTATRPGVIRNLVKEDGPDTMNPSDEESLKEEHGDVLTGVLTEGCTAPVLLSRSQVAQQRAAGSAIKELENQRMRAELDACDQGPAQGKMDTCVSHRHPF
jgi:hypothetical protein